MEYVKCIGKMKPQCNILKIKWEGHQKDTSYFDYNQVRKKIIKQNES